MTQTEERLPLQSPESARQYLFAGMVKFANLLPRGEADAKRFLTIAMSVLTQKPDLLRKASRESVLNCLIECARLNLEPEGTLQHAFLIPYGRECKIQVGYRGLCQLVYREAQVKKVWTAPVWEGEQFRRVLGDEHSIVHVPDDDAEERESSLEGLRGAYACIKLLSDEVDHEWMNLKALLKIKKGSKSDAWENWPVEMARKSPLKRLCKRQQTTSKVLADGIALDDREGKPRDPKEEIEPEVIEVREEFPSPVLSPEDEQQSPPRRWSGPEDYPDDKESRHEINEGIESAWVEFHQLGLDTRVLEMEAEYADYIAPERTSDEEAWKFRDKLIRENLKAKAARKHAAR